jgi:hypothetical protein
VADRDQVRKLVLLGRSREKIAAALGISVDQLTYAYRETLEFYQARMLGKLANQAYEMALKGNPFMVQFVLRTRAGWSENRMGDEETQVIKRVIGVRLEDV